jgi:hypothetical protein
MDPAELERLSRQFDDVAATIARPLFAASPHVVALVAKWQREDLVPGLSDMDFRVICDDDARANDWRAIDETLGTVHLDMVRSRPEWNRINEHPAGAGVTLAELEDDRTYNPECAAWTLWSGDAAWFESFLSRRRGRSFTAADERYHVQRFLSYFSSYQHGIDPPINLGPFEPKYALHSRCWHYFAPPMYSAACLLARRSFVGKREALRWLGEHGFVTAEVDAVVSRVDAHYETPELHSPEAMAAFESALFEGFKSLLRPVCDAVRHMRLDCEAGVPALKRQVAAAPADPLAVLLECTRFSRIRAGRYAFYLDAPDHFDAAWLLANEMNWLKKLVLPAWQAMCMLAGERDDASVRTVLDRLNIDGTPEEIALVQHLIATCDVPVAADQVRPTFRALLPVFPVYSGLLERVLAASLAADCRDGEEWNDERRQKASLTTRVD